MKEEEVLNKEVEAEESVKDINENEGMDISEIKEEVDDTVEDDKKIEQSKIEVKPKNKKKKGIVRRVFSSVITIILIIIIILSVIVAYRGYKYNSYDLFGYRLYTILSGSMEPMIHVGDGIITAEAKDYKVGDVVAFEHGDSITVHRIMEVVEDKGDIKVFQTKGDNNNSNDPFTIESSAIKGVYKFRISRLGDLVLFVRNNLPIVVGVILLILLLLIAKAILF